MTAINLERQAKPRRVGHRRGGLVLGGNEKDFFTPLSTSESRDASDEDVSARDSVTVDDIEALRLQCSNLLRVLKPFADAINRVSSSDHDVAVDLQCDLIAALSVGDPSLAGLSVSPEVILRPRGLYIRLASLVLRDVPAILCLSSDLQDKSFVELLRFYRHEVVAKCTQLRSRSQMFDDQNPFLQFINAAQDLVTAKIRNQLKLLFIAEAERLQHAVRNLCQNEVVMRCVSPSVENFAWGGANLEENLQMLVAKKAEVQRFLDMTYTCSQRFKHYHTMPVEFKADFVGLSESMLDCSVNQLDEVMRAMQKKEHELRILVEEYRGSYEVKLAAVGARELCKRQSFRTDAVGGLREAVRSAPRVVTVTAQAAPGYIPQ